MRMRVSPNPTNSSELYSQDTYGDGETGGNHDDVDSPVIESDFSEYMWMENEEEFDKEVLKQLEEEALMEQCIEAMLADERDEHAQHCSAEIVARFDRMRVQDQAEILKKSTLNPYAAEFIPKNTAHPESS